MLWLLLLTTGTTASLRGLSAVDDLIAWASGTKGTVIRTIDGGKTFKSITVPGAAGLDFRDVQAFSADHAILMSAGPGPLSRIYITKDGGQHWKLTLTNKEEKGFYDSIAFWNAKRGLLLGDAVIGHMTILRTEDGGETWTPATTLPPALENEGAFAASGTAVAVGPNGLAWFATGGAATARVYRSTDWGRTWLAAATPIRHDASASGIFSIAFSDAKHGVVVGGKHDAPTDPTDNIAITEDGGATWQAPKQRPSGYRSAVLLTKTLFIATGPAGSDISKDNGTTWQPIEQGFHALSKGGKSIWASGNNGAVAKLQHP